MSIDSVVSFDSVVSIASATTTKLCPRYIILQLQLALMVGSKVRELSRNATWSVCWITCSEFFGGEFFLSGRPKFLQSIMYPQWINDKPVSSLDLHPRILSVLNKG